MAKAGQAKKKDHPYEDLKGAALDEHMMAKHHWDASMIANRGSQTLAQKYHYIEDWHHSSHHFPPEDR